MVDKERLMVAEFMMATMFVWNENDGNICKRYFVMIEYQIGFKYTKLYILVFDSYSTNVRTYLCT